MSLSTRAEALSGETLTTTDADDWATDGAEELINLLPPPCLFTVSATKSDSGSGVDVSSCRILNVHKNGRPAREVPASFQGEVGDTESIYEATTFRPAFYKEAGKVHVEPGGGTVEVVSYPDVDASTTGVSNFPDDLERLVIIYMAKQSLIKTISEVRGEIPAEPTLPSPPTAPSDPAISYTNASSSAMSSTSISALPAPPDYTKVGVDLSFTNYNTTFSDEDIELGQMELNKLQADLQEYQADIQDELNDIQVDLEDYQREVDRLIEQARLDQARLQRDAEATDEVALQNKIQTLRGDIADYEQELGKFQGEIQNYRAEVEAKIQKQSREVQNKVQEVEVHMQEITKLDEQYQRGLQAFLSQYQVETPQS